MQPIPKLNPEQLKRLRKLMVDYGICPSFTKVRKVTDTSIKCRAVFLQLIEFINLNFNHDDIPDLGIDDLLELYAIDDYCINNKVGSELNCIDNKDNVSVDCIDNKKHKGRGKQKKPPMVFYPFRVPESMLLELKGLNGNVSEHIRLAIANYLEQKKRT